METSSGQRNTSPTICSSNGKAQTMPSCELRIVLAPPGITYHPGEKISGTVLASTTDGCGCNRLTIALQWLTHGKGNGALGTAIEHVLFVGDWKPAETHEYSFEIPAPAGPLTYHGTLLNVDWHLTARADVPGELTTPSAAAHRRKTALPPDTAARRAGLLRARFSASPPWAPVDSGYRRPAARGRGLRLPYARSCGRTHAVGVRATH